MTEKELTEIAILADKYNGVGKETAHRMVAHIRYLQRKYESGAQKDPQSIDPYETLHDTLTMRGT